MEEISRAPASRVIAGMSDGSRERSSSRAVAISRGAVIVLMVRKNLRRAPLLSRVQGLCGRLCEAHFYVGTLVESDGVYKAHLTLVQRDDE